MSLLKIGGKTDSNVAKAFRVDANGTTISKREIITYNVVLLNQLEIRDTNPYYSDYSSATRAAFENSAIKSLRFENTLNQPATITILDDYHKTQGTGYLFRINDTPIQIVLPAFTNVTKRYIISPIDIPEMDYLEYINFKVQCATAPTSGYLKCSAIIKS